MENKKPLNFIFGIIAVILGVVLFKQFNFETLKFKHTGLAIVYLITFVFSIYILVRNSKNQSEK